MKNCFFILGISVLVGFGGIACESKKLDPVEPALCDTVMVTYESHVKEIIDNTCAYAGCHDGAGGIGPGDYTNYAGLNPFLLSGSFKTRVIDQKDDPIVGMPPNKSAWPQSQIEDLTEEQLEIIQCWINANYPKN